MTKTTQSPIDNSMSHYQKRFFGSKLRVARLTSGLSLDELGANVSASRQYVHQLESDAKEPSDLMLNALATVLSVTPSFFSTYLTNQLREEDIHFRRLQTTPRALISQVVARSTIVEMIVSSLEKRVKFPVVDIPSQPRSVNVNNVELISAKAREHWGLGSDCPIKNVTRVLERAGVIVVHFGEFTDRIDALSSFRRRPVIVRSSAKATGVRLRFDLAHECGHLIMHQGLVTGDHETELEAHRFASSFLLPSKAFAKEFPRRTQGLDWPGIYAMKIRWGVSVQAILRRAFDLGVIDAAQYRIGHITLAKRGETKRDRYDEQVEIEKAELLESSLRLLATRRPASLYQMLDELGITTELFSHLTGCSITQAPANVIAFKASVSS